MAEDFRVTEALKLIRQGRRCEIIDPETGDKGCGAYVYSQEGWDRHMYWHQLLLNKIAAIDHLFGVINDYVKNPDTGLEVRVTTAITNTNGRVSALETEVVRPVTGSRARLTALETRVTALEALP